jgi:Ssu72-like protein
MNRSTSGHAELLNWGYERVTSYGTSDAVRLPSRVPGTNHAFPFGTRYADILSRMINNDNSMREWMQVYGLSNMLLRNASLKAAPESWRQLEDDEIRSGVDFALCYDRNVYVSVIQGALWASLLVVRRC